MTATAINFNMRLDKGLKERAFPVLESYGLSPAQAFKLFLNQVANTKTVPLTFDWGREETNVFNTQAKASILEGQREIAEGRTEVYDSLEQAIQAMSRLANGG
ncbi:MULTISPECIES: type II toxin-antitoxin system RelB/DinJ family antitoxin [unclassified Moraxella]|uniref:type II toxin-antitoxin system RelB/DinJ family antitoxin n=1 Tax=unclassified Moraxella TaxID=2685852 RepID=UPI003AF7521D